MNRFRFLPLLLVGLLACSQPAIDPATPDPAQPAVGIPTDVGQPMGSAVTQTIGPAGGVIGIPGTPVTFTFPAGAFSKEVAVTVQPIENKTPGGHGLAYSLSAPGAELLKDAAIKLHYTPDDLDGTVPEAIDLAHQDNNGIWQGRTDAHVDKATQTITAPISHLAHHAFYEQFGLRVLKNNRPVSSLAPVEQAQLEAFYQENLNDDEIPSLTVPLGKVKIISASRVVRWTINGVTDGVGKGDSYASVGQITEDQTLAKATYDAPTREPDNNPVVIGVELDLKQFGRLTLVRQVRIESPALLRVGGASDSNPNVALTVKGNQLLGAIVSTTGRPVVSFVVTDFRGKGTYGFPKPSDGGNQATAIDDGIGMAVGYYNDEPVWVSGNVTLTISEYNGPGKPIQGTMSGTFYRGRTPVEVLTRFRAVAAYVPE